MQIKRINAFSETAQGKVLCALLAMLIFSIQSCSLYRATEVAPGELATMSQVTEHANEYKFYVHSQNGSFEIADPVLDDKGGVTGTLKKCDYEQPDSTWGMVERKAYWQHHKFDVNFYCSSGIEEEGLRADNQDNGVLVENKPVTIHPEMMDKVTITSIDKEQQIAGAALVVLIILAVAVGTFLIVLLTTLLAKASSDESNESSGNSGSNSGSDSNSGGSNSGSSGG